MKKRDAFRLICFICVFCILFVIVSAVLRDKRIAGEYNPTTKIRGFYQEQKDSLDFVFVGSSQLYAHVAPAVLWEEYGFTSYDFAANEQPLWISYYYIKEALKHQKPKAIILEVFTVYGDDYEQEGVNHINLDDLPLSANKLRAIHDSVPGELRYSYYFDLAKYHNTWSSLDQDKVEAAFGWDDDPMKGYSPFVFEREYASGTPDEVKRQKEVEQIPAKAQEWLDKIIALTREENVDLIFLKTPNGSAERQKLYNAVEILSEREKIPFLNLNTCMDGEAHINIIQAKKVTERIGSFLEERYEAMPKTQRPDAVREGFDRSAKLFDSYYKKCMLASIEDYDSYLSFVRADNYLVFLCKNMHEGSDLAEMYLYDGTNPVIAETMHPGDADPWYPDGEAQAVEAFANPDASDGSNHPEAAEAPAAGAIDIETELYDMQIHMIAGADSMIEIDGLDYSLHTNGYNLAVYDKNLGQFVEMVSFDETNGMQITRK